MKSSLVSRVGYHHRNAVDNWVRSGSTRQGYRRLEKASRSPRLRTAGKRRGGSNGHHREHAPGLNTFKDSLSGGLLNVLAEISSPHLRSNLTIRIPVTSLTSLPSSAVHRFRPPRCSSRAKPVCPAKTVSSTPDHRLRLQQTGQDSEPSCSRNPDTEQLDAMLRAGDSHVVITLRESAR